MGARQRCRWLCATLLIQRRHGFFDSQGGFIQLRNSGPGLRLDNGGCAGDCILKNNPARYCRGVFLHVLQGDAWGVIRDFQSSYRLGKSLQITACTSAYGAWTVVSDTSPAPQPHSHLMMASKESEDLEAEIGYCKIPGLLVLEG
jgi:hypothetical protein